jgi:Flp pilus assembly protein TadG
LGRRRARGQQGVAAVEFALLLIPFLVLAFATIQFSAWFFSAQSGTAAAREVARRSAVGDLTCAELTTAARDNSQLVASEFSVTRSFTSGSPVVGDNVSVLVTYKTLNFHFPFVPVPGQGQAIVNERATARVENVTAKSTVCP